MTRERGDPFVVELWSKSQSFKEFQRRKSTEFNHQAFLLALDPVSGNGALCLEESLVNAGSRIWALDEFGGALLG